MEYKYCQTCGGAMSERIEYASDMLTIVSWLRYEYDGLNLLRIDEKYDGDDPPDGLDENDPWRPLNVFIHGPGAIGQIVKGKGYNYYSDGQNPTSCCDSGEYYYFYDALGNVNGVLDSGGHYYRWEMDAFGNDLPSGNTFLPMDQPGPKEHLTGKMFDTTTGLYYFQARWYDPQVGRLIGRDPAQCDLSSYNFAENDPLGFVDPTGACSQDIHRDKTERAWAGTAYGKFCPGSRRRIIEDANVETDRSHFFANREYHCFDRSTVEAGLQAAQTKLDGAIGLCDDYEFGMALHFAQDCYAHYDVRNMREHGLGKRSVDRRCERPDIAKKLLATTEKFIDAYACKCCPPSYDW